MRIQAYPDAQPALSSGAFSICWATYPLPHGVRGHPQTQGGHRSRPGSLGLPGAGGPHAGPAGRWMGRSSGSHHGDKGLAPLIPCADPVAAVPRVQTPSLYPDGCPLLCRLPALPWHQHAAPTKLPAFFSAMGPFPKYPFTPAEGAWPLDGPRLSMPTRLVSSAASQASAVVPGISLGRARSGGSFSWDHRTHSQALPTGDAQTAHQNHFEGHPHSTPRGPREALDAHLPTWMPPLGGQAQGMGPGTPRLS